MSATAWFATAITLANTFGLGGLLLWYVRDRRRTHAEATRAEVDAHLAERTLEAQVDLSSITAVEAHVAFVEKAFETERASKDRQIAELQRLLTESEGRERALVEKVTALQRQVSELQDELTHVQDKLAEVARDLGVDDDRRV